MSRAPHNHPWSEFNLIGPRQTAQRLRQRRFWLALALPQCLGLFGLLLIRAVLPVPQPIAHEQSPPHPEYDTKWLQHWQANRAHATELLAVLAGQTPAGVMLTSLKQEEDQLMLTGRSSRAEALPQLVRVLKTRTGYRHLRQKEASAGLHQSLPVQHFVLVLSNTDPSHRE